MSTQEPFTRYWFGFSGLIRSQYRSCTSSLKSPIPQAMRALCPMTTPGKPGKENPRAWNAPEEASLECRPTSYQIEGICTPKWVSLARMGLPVAVRLPAMTQLLVPTPSRPPGKRGNAEPGACGIPATPSSSSERM